MHINLQIWCEGDLRDPEHPLQGTGKKMMHVKVRNLDGVKVDALKALVKEAVEIRIKG